MTLQGRRLTIFTEGGRDRGLGHLMRCEAYAEGWRRRGGDVAWIVDGDDAARAVLSEERKVEFAPWQTVELRAPDGLVLIDSYCAALATYERLAPAGGVFIDDYGRLEYPAGVVVHSAPGELAPHGDAEWLTGPEWHPLRSDFWAVSPRLTRDTVERILVVLGGVDHRGLGDRLAQRVRRLVPSAGIDLVLGAASEDGVRASDIRTHQGLTACQMRDLMREADIAVTAAGQTLYELACCGCPALLIGVADNQAKHMAFWPSTGAGKTVGWWSDDNLEAELDRHILDLSRRAGARSEMSASGRRLVDGRGVHRLWEHVLASGL